MTRHLSKISEKRAMLLVFGSGIILHTFYAFQMDMMSIDPNEFGVAAWTALFSGKNWSGAMSGINYYYGFVGALIYVPFMVFINNPFAQYKAMLILNGIIVSFVPIIAYQVSVKTGVRYSWQRILAAVVCGLYSTVFAHTKFIWNEISCVVFPWLIVFLFIRTSDAKNSIRKHILSALTAIVCAISYFAHPRLISVVLSSVIIIFYARFIMKKKLVYLSSFFTAFALTGSALGALSLYLTSVMWQGNTVVLQNTVPGFIGFLSALKTIEGWQLFFKTVIGHLYYFATSTWGLGVIAVCMVLLLQFRYLRNRKENHYGIHLVLFSVYALCSNLFSVIVSALSKFNETGFGQFQDTVIFGRYMDSVIPLLILFVICYAFMYSLDLPKLLVSTVALGLIYGLFFVFTAPIVVKSPKTRISPMLGIYPIRIGERIDDVITFEGLFLTVSCVLCFTAVFIVVVCCAKKYRAIILSVLMITIMLYSSLYTATVYLPFAANDEKKVNTPIYEVNQHIYNSDDAPPVYSYNLPRRTSSLLQFLNQDATLISVYSMAEIAEHCFIVVKNEDRLALKPQSEELLLELAQTGEYTIYAYGERAVAFAQSQTNEE